MAEVRFGILGPLEARTDGRLLSIGGPKRRALLAMLLLHANREVTVGRIIEGLWGDEPPASARAQVQSLVHALRRRLEVGDECEATIETRPESYTLVSGAEGVDLLAFERAAAEARDAVTHGHLERAAASFRAAVALWRGPALDGLDAPFVNSEAPRLEERRLLVLEERAEVELALGRHAALIADLVALVAQHPLRERLRAALMLALYRSGRRADALEVCRSGRAAMVEELGLDPGPDLQALERAILRAEPSLDLPVVPSPEPDDSRVSAEDEGGPQPASQPQHHLQRRRRRVALTLAAAAALVAASGMALGHWALVGRAGQGAASSSSAGCKMQSRTVTDYRGRHFDRVYHCGTFIGVSLYANPEDSAPLEDVTFMNASVDNWVICQMRGRPNPVFTGRTSNWWLYTQGDTDNRPNDYGYTNAWAFMPATVIIQGERNLPVPGVPICSLDYAVPGRPTVSSPDYPADGASHGAPGQVGLFVFAPATGTGDLDGWLYGLDSDAPDTFVASGGRTTVRLRPPSAGMHTLSLRARDRAGNLSPPRTYSFTVAG